MLVAAEELTAIGTVATNMAIATHAEIGTTLLIGASTPATVGVSKRAEMIAIAAEAVAAPAVMVATCGMAVHPKTTMTTVGMVLAPAA